MPDNEQPHATVWPPQLVRQLGKRPDAEIAKLAGCSNESVRRERARRKIAAYRPAIRWTDKQVEIIERLPPAEAAKRVGVSYRAVLVERSRRGIARRIASA